MNVPRRILHIDMDAFFASVEQAANPGLRGKPLIVGGRPDRKRTVVCAASYEAKRLGIDSGMSAQEAFRICPQAVFVAADSAKYLYVSGRISDMLRYYSPQLEQASIDEFYLDVTGCDARFGSYLELGMHIKNAISAQFHITGSVGISINRLMSKIASKLKKPDGMLILDEPDIPIVLADLPVGKIPGIGSRLTRRLHELSVFSFADLRKFPRDLLAEKFGKIGMWMYGVAHPQCVDEEEIQRYDQPESPPKSVGHSYTVPHNLYSRQEVEAWLRLLSEMVAARLRRYGREARIVHVYLRKPDMESVGQEKISACRRMILPSCFNGRYLSRENCITALSRYARWE
jgi:Nucleotidyltransferase/DNA polymerase involved in DNA repair